MDNRKLLTDEQQENLLNVLQSRFEVNMQRHEGFEWDKIQKKIVENVQKIWSLNEMERSGGEPDVLAFDEQSGEYIFYDCAPESPKHRRSICYDPEALSSRKENKPKHSAVGMAYEMGIEILTESQYHELQKSGTFDIKTSSWIKTPPEIRKRGGAIFCDRRYNHVFTYHNGAESYYAARGFRAALRI